MNTIPSSNEELIKKILPLSAVYLLKCLFALQHLHIRLGDIYETQSIFIIMGIATGVLKYWNLAIRKTNKFCIYLQGGHITASTKHWYYLLLSPGNVCHIYSNCRWNICCNTEIIFVSDSERLPQSRRRAPGSGNLWKNKKNIKRKVIAITPWLFSFTARYAE